MYSYKSAIRFEVARKQRGNPKRPAGRPGAEVHETSDVYVRQAHDITCLEPAQEPRNCARQEDLVLRFNITYDRGGKASWWLYAANNQLVAWAGESFASLSNAQRAATAFRTGASTARYDIYLDANGYWRWRAWRGSDKVAASGEAFSSQYAAENAAAYVRDNAGSAAGAAA